MTQTQQVFCAILGEHRSQICAVTNPSRANLTAMRRSTTTDPAA